MVNRINDNANVLKAILTLMVIYIHSFSLVPAAEGTLLYDVKLYFSFIIPRVAVPMFFMYSGYFFFKGKKMNFQIWYDKMKVRLITLVLPFVIWSVIGAVFFLVLDKSYRNFNFGELLNCTFWMDSYTPSSIFPQWVGYEIPKVTALNMPLWYVRDLILLMLVSPFLNFIFKCKTLTLFTLLSLLCIFLFLNTDKIPYFGIDNLLFFMSGAYLSYESKDFFLKIKSVIIIGCILAIVASTWAFLAYSHEEEVMSRHVYIFISVVFLLSVPISNKVRNAFAKLQFGGVNCSLYTARIL